MMPNGMAQMAMSQTLPSGAPRLRPADGGEPEAGDDAGEDAQGVGVDAQ